MENTITEFLIRAKQKTYAGKGAEVISSRKKSHDLAYEEGNRLYYDTYLGGDRFAGEEALWIDNTPYWAMNYVGRVTGENFSGDFLKEALLNIPAEYPFRGPARYENGDYLYTMEYSGEFQWFQGKELIYFKGNQIYECYFHGGTIK